MKYKLHFPVPYAKIDFYNDNIDVNIIAEDGNVYVVSLFTLENIQSLMVKDKSPYFWSSDMVIVKDLHIASIRAAIAALVDDGYFQNAACKIGDIGKIFGAACSFDQLTINELPAWEDDIS